MRVKALPPAPGDVAGIHDARDAVPLVPKPELDCCDRLVRRLDLPGRDVAREWLTVLRGLGLVEETTRGFTRTDAEGDPDRLAEAFLDGVFGARECLAVLESADGAVTVEEVFAVVAEEVPTWERARDPDGWFDRWHERVTRILDWLVLLGLAERSAGGYTHG